MPGVYMFWYRLVREAAESSGRFVWACKVGCSRRNAMQRALSQGGMDQVVVGLLILTDQPLLLEKWLHSALSARGQAYTEAQGREWFVTSPDNLLEVLESLRLPDGFRRTVVPSPFTDLAELSKAYAPTPSPPQGVASPPSVASPRYRCDICGYSTDRKSNLANHRRRTTPCGPSLASHLGAAAGGSVAAASQAAVVAGGSGAAASEAAGSDLGHKCTVCLHDFTSRFNLTRHLESGKCKGAPKYSCPMCSRPFATRKAKTKHRSRCSAKVLAPPEPAAEQSVAPVAPAAPLAPAPSVVVVEAMRRIRADLGSSPGLRAMLCDAVSRRLVEKLARARSEMFPSVGPAR